MTSFEALVTGATLPRKSVPLCVAGALQAEWEDLERELQDLDEAIAKGDRASLGGSPLRAERDALLGRLAKLRDEMQAHEHVITFQALPRRAWSDLVAMHPPRAGVEDDQVSSANMDTFPGALIAACAVDPVMSPEQVDRLNDVLTDAQYASLYQACMVLNRAEISVPKYGIGYEALRGTERKSKPPAPGESPDGGSSAGSLAG
jgi:hypothetical protein